VIPPAANSSGFAVALTTPAFKELKNQKFDIQAEILIRSIKLRDDRVFVRECLLNVAGVDRLSLVNEYLKQWQHGSNEQPDPIKSDNAGRYRANTWLREKVNP
jgi:hypothetical protein